jgi:LacI family transcriptional regulator
VANSQNEIARQGDLLLQMLDEQVGGVAIVSPTREPTPTYHVTQLRRNHIPVVFCHRPMEGIAAPSLVFSGLETGRLVGERLAELGHRKVAMLFASRYSMVDERLAGLEATMACVGGEVIPLEFAPARDSTPAETNASIRRVLDATCGGADRPTAIFCGLTSDAECVYMWAQEAGLRLPDDLSLVCFGSSWHEHGFAEQVATVAVAEHEIGARAAKLLFEMQTGKLPLDCAEQIVFPPSLVRGGTIGPAPKTVRRGMRTSKPHLVEEIA